MSDDDKERAKMRARCNEALKRMRAEGAKSAGDDPMAILSLDIKAKIGVVLMESFIESELPTQLIIGSQIVALGELLAGCIKATAEAVSEDLARSVVGDTVAMLLSLVEKDKDRDGGVTLQ